MHGAAAGTEHGPGGSGFGECGEAVAPHAMRAMTECACPCAGSEMERDGCAGRVRGATVERRRVPQVSTPGRGRACKTVTRRVMWVLCWLLHVVTTTPFATRSDGTVHSEGLDAHGVEDGMGMRRVCCEGRGLRGLALSAQGALLSNERWDWQTVHEVVCAARAELAAPDGVVRHGASADRGEVGVRRYEKVWVHMRTPAPPCAVDAWKGGRRSRHGMRYMARRVWSGGGGDGIGCVVAQQATAMPYCMSRAPSCGGAVMSRETKASL